jgi:hypothetical protein
MQTAPPKAVRVRHVRTETGQWVDKTIPALRVSPSKKMEIMLAMFQRCGRPR